MLGQLPGFELVERTGLPFSAATLGGQVWVADFVFTRCGGPCPLMSARMRDLQSALAGFNNVKLVTFSVDPEHDTPEVLSRYAERFGAQPGRWFFLTGNPEPIYALARQSFKLVVQQEKGSSETAEDDGSILHSTHFVLLDKRARIRGYYDSAEPENLLKLQADVERLVREADIP